MRQLAEERDLDDPPALSLNLPRRMAAAGFRPGSAQRFLVFDPATLRNEPVTVRLAWRPSPAAWWVARR